MVVDSPAAVPKQQEENTEDDAGGADVDANDDAAEGGLSIPALALAPPLWTHSTTQSIQSDVIIFNQNSSP